LSTLPLFAVLVLSIIILVIFHTARWLCCRHLGRHEREQLPDFHLNLCSGLRSYDIADHPTYRKVLPGVYQSMESTNWRGNGSRLA
jgi:hypothetical protein